MNWSSGEYRILNQDDYLLVERQNTPALQTAIGDEPHRESFNEWQCFPAAAAEIDCFEEKSRRPVKEIDPEERDGMGYYPTIVAEKDGHTYFFEAPGWVDLDICQAETAKWKTLIDGQPGFCTFAASWPPNAIESKTQVSEWVIYGLKTPAGRTLAPVYDPDAPDEDMQN
jgi:hypothetical protein